jgi:hypothetical protein
MGNLPSVSLLMVSFHGKKIFGYPRNGKPALRVA